MPEPKDGVLLGSCGALVLAMLGCFQGSIWQCLEDHVGPGWNWGPARGRQLYSLPDPRLPHYPLIQSENVAWSMFCLFAWVYSPGECLGSQCEEYDQGTVWSLDGEDCQSNWPWES